MYVRLLLLILSYWICWHTDQGNFWSVFSAHVVGELVCGCQPTAPTFIVWSWSSMDCFTFASAVKGFWRRFYPYRDQTTMPCLWAPIRAKQLSMAATVGVIWPYACVRYWPGRRLVYVCPLLVCLNLKTTFFRWRSQKLSGGLGWFCCVCFFLFLITSVKFLYLYSLACYCSIDHLYTLLPPRPQWCNFWGKWI